MVHGRSRWQPKRSSINIPVKLPLAGAATSTIYAFVATKYFCRDKYTCVATKDVFCHDKSFVATKMILMAAPANDLKLFADLLTILLIMGKRTLHQKLN